jgi:hypothetical protein
VLPARLVDLLPAFAAELDQALRAEGEDELADQIASLVIQSPCGCGDDFCSSFYTGSVPNGAWGPSLRHVTPVVTTGMVVLDVVDDLVRYVEVLYRDDIKAALAGPSRCSASDLPFLGARTCAAERSLSQRRLSPCRTRSSRSRRRTADGGDPAPIWQGLVCGD